MFDREGCISVLVFTVIFALKRDIAQRIQGGQNTVRLGGISKHNETKRTMSANWSTLMKTW